METADRPHLPAHACLVCGRNACFGFTSRPKDVWTCLAHRQEGERHLVAPSAPGRDKAAPGRSAAGLQASR